MTHELTLNQHINELKKNFIALKATILEESDESNYEKESESDVAFLARKLRNFMRKKKTYMFYSALFFLEIFIK